MNKRTAVIAGASGFIGRRIAGELVSNGWDVIGLARRPPADPALRWIALDLADGADSRHKLGELEAVTHIFYAARFDHPQEGRPEAVEANAAMLANTVSALEPVAPLEHVHAVHGSKYYGHQLGPVRLPMREDDPRAPGANFYFVQEDFLRAASRGKKWTFTTTRPHAFCDPAIDHPRSFGLVLAVYAAIQRELGLPLHFPGTPKAYGLRTQFTDLGLLARAIVWMATEPRCANQAFNVVNGDNPRWSDLWARLAQWFGLEAGAARGIRLVDYVADKAPVWDAIVAKHDLRPTRLNELVLWAYGDYQFSPQWDIRSDMSKARALGFPETRDSGEMFFRQFEHYRAEKIIP